MLRILARTRPISAAAGRAAARPVSAVVASSSLRPLLLYSRISSPLRSFASPSSAPPRPPLPPTSRRDPFLNQPRGTRILPPGDAGDESNHSGQDPNSEPGVGAKLKMALGVGALITLAVVISGVNDWWRRKQASEAQLLESSLDARAELAYRGFPLELLTALRAAKEVARRGEQEAAAAEQRCAEEMERLHPSQAHRYARVPPGGADVFSDPPPEVAKAQAKALSTDSPARTLLARQTPSLLEAERLLRLILAQHLAFTGLDLTRMGELAEMAAPPSSPAQNQRQKKESAAAAAERAASREAAQRELAQLMSGTSAGSPSVHEAAGIQVDKAVLPYVLSLLAHNLQLQARVIQERANVEAANATKAGGDATTAASVAASASAAASSSASIPLPVSLSHAAARKYRESEQSYLQSLALYRHHLLNDPRPLAVGVLRGLGGLYLDAGRADRAEQVWVKAMDMLAGSRRSLEAWQADAAAAQALPARVDAAPTFLNRASDRIQDPAWLQAHSRMSSELAAALAELHRSRGEYSKSISWTQEALREWDRYWTERSTGALPPGVDADAAADPTATEMHTVKAATNTTRSNSGANYAATLSPEQRNQLIALDSLPRAMHLLSALAHDLHEQSASTPSSGSGSKQSADALATGVQALQALERVVALSAHVRLDSEAIAAAAAMESAMASNQQQADAAYAPFLDPGFVRQVHRMLIAMETPPTKPASAANSAAARAAAVTPSATEPEVHAEACAAYSNLAMMLAVAGASKEADATAAREIAVHVCPKPKPIPEA